MSELEPNWAHQPFEEKFRFSKFYLQTLFDGGPHLVTRGVNFPAHWSKEEVAKKLRNAAWWRRTTVRLSHCPQGVWVQSAEDVSPPGLEGTPELRDQLARALEREARLKEELWQLKNQ